MVVLAVSFTGVVWYEAASRTKDNNKRDAVWQRENATEAIQLWLDGWITVHVEVVCDVPLQLLRPSYNPLPRP
jgi:hypothetical protein